MYDFSQSPNLLLDSMEMQFAKPGIAAVEQIWKNKFPGLCGTILRSISNKGILTGGKLKTFVKK